MSKMTFTQPRATLEELLEFANRVRLAGGGNPLDALMPAVPEDPEQCLIAKNLNFNCSVAGWSFRTPDPEIDESWVMRVYDEDVAKRIAAELDLPLYQDVHDPEELARRREVYVGHIRMTAEEATRRFNQYREAERNHPEYGQWGVVLPPEIGAVAQAFDEWASAIDSKYDFEARASRYSVSGTPGDIAVLEEFWPYVEESIREAYSSASFVNEKGELVL